MSINRHHRGDASTLVVRAAIGCCVAAISAGIWLLAARGIGQEPAPSPLETPVQLPGASPAEPPREDGAAAGLSPIDDSPSTPAAKPTGSHPTEAAETSRREAAAFAERMIEYMTLGPPIEAKLRQRVWAAGREVVEVGRYQQAGRGTGRLRMELQVPIADGKGHWQQTCDGRLAWTREELAGEIRVRRVDLGKLEEATAAARSQRVPPRLRVGGLAEIIDRIQADFELQLSEGHIDGRAMLVLKGTLRQNAADNLIAGSPETEWPALVPRQVRIAVAADSLAAPLPSRIEFWSEPAGRLISLLEIYDVAEIDSPGLDQFRFEPGGDDFANETELYIARFAVGLAATPLGSTKR